jgi:hypothetical protein
MDVRTYNDGGYIEGSSVPIRIHPDECLISLEDVRAGRLRCSRIGHPTATSDCAKRHV